MFMESKLSPCRYTLTLLTAEDAVAWTMQGIPGTMKKRPEGISDKHRGFTGVEN